jgi:hypothetical protein
MVLVATIFTFVLMGAFIRLRFEACPERAVGFEIATLRPQSPMSLTELTEITEKTGQKYHLTDLSQRTLRSGRSNQELWSHMAKTLAKTGDTQELNRTASKPGIYRRERQERGAGHETGIVGKPDFITLFDICDFSHCRSLWWDKL